ncbi:PBP1A family penicillin-binding protein [Desulfoferrobacter suflitae]|uniref:PBP1A family penicillin-binding protein n=1 Tax=Desulfoferrobacter suflitae TaxID=2865782 RepID=UPI002164BBFE|nr:PBP1A family penicillin-binding protein [Desulfoferrobacter suflitae]MCK8602122.1 PBP1A family penicillin-binding protein [Desulfoferrobacter suflitae]
MVRTRKKKKTKKLFWWKLLTLAAFIMSVVATGYFLYLYMEVQNRFATRKWSVPSRVFSAALPIYPGHTLALSDLKAMLDLRRYQEAYREPLQPGEYKVRQNNLAVHLRAFRFPGRTLPQQRVRFVFANDNLARIEGERGNIAIIELEPTEIARLYGPERESRLLINIKQVPPELTEAVVAIEDHRFYAHPGIDWWGISRALWADLAAGRVVQGGSTITQQLVKNYFLEPERSIKRKVLEASMALIIEALYQKDEILEMYMNEIYLGQRGSVAIHGMGEAARYYFGRDVQDLNLAEAATLAGLIRAPNRYSPTKNPESAKERRNVVLKRMLDLGKISSEQYRSARSQPLRIAKSHLPLKFSPYFVDYVRQQLQELYSPTVLETTGLNIYTTLVPEISLAAEKAVSEGLAELEKTHPKLTSNSPKEALQAVLIAVQPKTGTVLSLIGGRDYAESSFNRALYAHRQPGSAIKPFVYLRALDEFTPVSWLPDELKTYSIGGTAWAPKNYNGRYRGRVTFRTALEDSLNAATVSLAMATGLDNIIQTLRSLGIQSPLKPYPSLALGAFEITPLELAGAYATLDNDGQKPHLLTVKEVVSEAGEIQQRRNVDLITVTTPARCFIITNILQGVVQDGTATILKRLGVNFPCAGKTGTTSDYRDSWFAGYTTDLLVLVWVGFDDNRSTHLSGAQGAARIWARFVNEIRPRIRHQQFHIPPGVVERYVCTQSEMLATKACPDRRPEYFLDNRVPEAYCTLHAQY